MAGAGYRDWTAGEVPTATQFDTYLQEQTIMRFATTAARDTALSSVLAEGMYAYVNAGDTKYFYNGAAWVIVHEPPQSWNVTNVTQGVSVACTTASGYFQRRVSTWTAQITLTMTAAGTAGQPVVLATPMTLANVNEVGGSWIFLDLSAGSYGAGSVIPVSTNSMGFLIGGPASGSGQAQLGVNAPTLASGDVLRVTSSGTY